MSDSQPPPRPATADDWRRRHATLGPFERVGYVGLGEQYNRWIYRLRRRHFLRLARRHGIAAAARVLDVGCGTGFYVGLYRRLSVPDVCGIDISPDAVDECRRAFPECRFHVADASAGLPPQNEPGGFDWVSAMDALYHITEDGLFAAALANCARAVRPGGRLVVSDNFPARTLPADAHQSYHAMDDYLAVLQPLGFTLIEVSPVFFCSNGQVCAAGPGRLAAAAWRLFARALGKTLRTWRSAGECLGAVTGAALTAIDALLQRQGRFRGWSTKVAVFVRDGPPR